MPHWHIGRRQEPVIHEDPKQNTVVDATEHWVEEHWRRYRAEAKGGGSEEAYVRFDNARDLALVGRHDAASDELRVMLEQPGGHLFRLVDTTPAFNVLKSHPGYLELEARIGDWQSSSN